MSLSACNGIFENIYDAPIETEMEIKENSFSQVKTVEYTEWAYINLSERTVTTVKIGEEYESQIPDKWDFAIHRYDIKTNEGAAYKTTYTSIDEFKATGKLPKAEDFVKRAVCYDLLGEEEELGYSEIAEYFASDGEEV